MAERTLSLELPEELVDLLGSPEAAVAKAREALVFELLREAKISQGQAARVLGISRWEVVDLMGTYHIPSGPEDINGARLEIESVHRLGPER